MGWVVSNYLIGGVTPTQQGNENMTSAPSGTFQTRDGLLNISANEEKQWKALVHHLGWNICMTNVLQQETIVKNTEKN